MILPAARKLVEILSTTAHRLDFVIPPDVNELATCPETTFVSCGQGVIAFSPRPWGVTYVNVAFPPGDYVGHRQAYRVFCCAKLRYSSLVAVVHPKNLVSVKTVKKLGGTPIGVDPEGFIHFDLQSGRTHHAQPAPPT